MVFDLGWNWEEVRKEGRQLGLVTATAIYGVWKASLSLPDLSRTTSLAPRHFVQFESTNRRSWDVRICFPEELYYRIIISAEALHRRKGTSSPAENLQEQSLPTTPPLRLVSPWTLYPCPPNGLRRWIEDPLHRCWRGIEHNRIQWLRLPVQSGTKSSESVNGGFAARNRQGVSCGGWWWGLSSGVRVRAIVGADNRFALYTQMLSDGSRYSRHTLLLHLSSVFSSIRPVTR